jgi:hypothetical protein
MLALAIASILALAFVVVVYGRAIVYALSEEYQLDKRIEDVTKR